MIDYSQQILLEALKASLFNVKPDYPIDVNWDLVIREANAQTITGLISTVIPVNTLVGDQEKAIYMRILYEQDRLIKLFEKNNIKCVILKGCAVAVYYPKPYLRAMGDIDVLVLHEDYLDAIDLLKRNGYEYTFNDENIERTLNGSARELEFFINGIEIELHHHFSSPGFEIDDYLEKAIHKREFRELNGFCFPVLPEIENGLVLLGHINHHLKNNDIGLRQFVDWEMYLHALFKDNSWNECFFPLLNDFGLNKLAANVTLLCCNYLGLPEKFCICSELSEDLSEELLSIIFTDGNFGRKATSSTEKDERHIRYTSLGVERYGFFGYFSKVGMVACGKRKVSALLKPFFFIIGIFRTLFKGFIAFVQGSSIKKQIKDGKNRYDLYNKIGVKT